MSHGKEIVKSKKPGRDTLLATRWRAQPRRWFLRSILLASSSGCLSSAQSKTGEITGTILDTTKDVVTGATVTVVEMSVGNSQTAKSSPLGLYLIPKLPVGAYELAANAQGFQPFKQNVFVTDGAKVQVDIHLERSTLAPHKKK
jgi:Carboxypeptidase regulatory-like domain